MILKLPKTFEVEVHLGISLLDTVQLGEDSTSTL